MRTRKNRHPGDQPPPLSPREKNKGQKPVKNNHDQDQAQRGLQNFINAPCPVAKNREADQHGNRGHGHLREHCHRYRRTLTADAEPRLYVLLECVDIVLKFARKELANFGIEAVHVRDQGQQTEQHQQHDGDDVVHDDARLRRCLATIGVSEFDRRICDLFAAPIAYFSRSILLASRGLPQALLLAAHLTTIEFMIVSGEMQHSMQDQNFDLLRCCMPKPSAFCPAISTEIATSPANLATIPGIAGNDSTSVGLFFPRKRRFNRLHFLAAGHEHTDRSRSPLARRARVDKPSQRSFAQPSHRC